MSQPEPTDLEKGLADEDRINDEEAMRSTGEIATDDEPDEDADNAADCAPTRARSSARRGDAADTGRASRALSARRTRPSGSAGFGPRRDG
jgi:hypothetical protein